MQSTESIKLFNKETNQPNPQREFLLILLTSLKTGINSTDSENVAGVEEAEDNFKGGGYGEFFSLSLRYRRS